MFVFYLTTEAFYFFQPTNMKRQLVALIFLVTFVFSARAYYLRLHGMGKRGSFLQKKSLSRLNSAGKTRNLKGKYYLKARN